MTENLGIGYVGIKGMKYGAVPPIPMPRNTPEKLEIFQWQHDALIDLLARKCTSHQDWQDMWAFVGDNFEVQKMIQTGEDVKNVYVFFGYKQDATHYRLEHDIDPRDMVLVRNYDMLINRRARPIRVGQDSEWYWHNWNHHMSIEARYLMSVMENTYGTADA